MKLTSLFSNLIRNSWLPLLIIFFILVPAGLNAQSVTNIDISSTVVQAGVQRLGMNMGAHDYYDSGQLTKNLVFRNPGFEPQIYQSTVRCMAGTATTCTDDDAWGAWPANFWQGATYEFIYGTAKGRTGTVVSNTAVVGGVNGVTLSFDHSGTAPAVGDYLILRKSISGNPTAGWWTNTQGQATLTPETSDLPPGTPGVQSLRVTVPTASDYASVASYFDGTSGMSFVQLNGYFELSFKAKATQANSTLQVALYRSGGESFIPQQTITLSSNWQTYNLDFNASEDGTAVGAVNLIFSGTGPTGFLMDEVSLLQTNSSAANPTQFRDAVLNTLQAYNPGSLRYWDSQLGESLDNWIAPPFGRKPAGYTAWSADDPTDISVGLNEFLQLCQTLGSDAWIVIPVTFDQPEASNLIDFLSGPASTTYGAKRVALGQSAPWTSVIRKIHLELGNEAWSSTFRGGSMEYSDAYGIYSNTVFGSMRANPNFVPSSYDLVVGGQEVYVGRNQLIVSNANQQDTLAVAGYISPTVDNFANNEELFGPLFAEPEEDNSPSGYLGQNRPLFPKLAVYEANMGTTSGAITQSVLNEYVSSLGAGIAMADQMLMMIRDLGISPIHLWQLGQWEFSRTDGKTVFLYGTVVDMGVTNRRRPQFVAGQLANHVIVGDMIQATQGGPGPNANPTWNQPLENGVEFGAAHYIQSYAFANGTNRSIILFNLHRTDSLQVTFTGVNAPSGSVGVHQLTSVNITDTNETALNANTVASSLTGFDPTVPYTLPPYSMTVLTWTAPSTTDITMSVAPGTVTLSPGQSRQFSASVSNTSNTNVVWSINPSLGSISATGLYSAPAAFTVPQTVVVTATSVADPTKFGTASISLAPLVVVGVLPNVATLTASQTEQFATTILNTNNGAVTWSLSPNVGTVSSTGLYTAPPLVVVTTPVTVTATSVASPSSYGTASLTLTPSVASGSQGTSFPPFGVNAGGSAYTDSTGFSWQADIGANGGSASKVTNAIAGTADPTPYQTQRWGSYQYAFAAPNGTYQVTLKFAELFWTSPGQRVFNVLINGQNVLSNFDIVAAAGANFTAVDRVITTAVTNNQLVVSFQTITNFPAVNAIKIVEVGNPVTITPNTASLNPGQSMQFKAQGGSNSYTWMISPSLGSISTSGLYTAPSTVNGSQSLTVSAMSSGTASNTANATVNLLPSGSGSSGGTVAAAIHCGGPSYTDSSGVQWVTDTDYSGGSTQTVGAPIAATTSDALYQSNRWGNFFYTIPLVNGTYTVTLKFAELFWTSSGQRVFNAFANGQPVLQNFDIIAAAGAPFTAVDRSFKVTVTQGVLSLTFGAITDNPLVSAIEVTQ